MTKLSKQLKKYFEKVGAMGGKTSSEKMTPEQRKERARKAGLASGKARGKKKADNSL